MNQHATSIEAGLDLSEVFECADTMTVSDVIKVLARDDDDVDRYRGQQPYIVDGDKRLVGVVSLRGLLATKRGALLITDTDMAGFFFVLSLATLMMPWLV